jgi:hypothetical protein
MSATEPAAQPRAIGVNRRQALRARLVTQIESRGPGGSSIGHTEDVSETGLLVLTRETFEPQTEVTIRFNLPPVPPGRPLECQGVVVRSEPGAHMAVQFTNLGDEDRKALADYVRRTSVQG